MPWFFKSPKSSENTAAQTKDESEARKECQQQLHAAITEMNKKCDMPFFSNTARITILQGPKHECNTAIFKTLKLIMKC